MFGRSHIFFRLTDYLRGRPPYLTLALALSMVAWLGLIDYWTGPDLSTSIFYLLPIGLTGWVLGGRWAMFMSALATLVWFIADVATGATGPGYASTLAPYWNALIRFGYFILISYLFSFVQSTLERERTLSRTDALTGAMNGYALREFGERELERLRRYPHPLSVAYLDLDNFKYVNDRFGHAAGDDLLIAVVSTLGQVMRKTDLVARLGGDEFAVVMVETSPEAARRAFVKAQAALLSAMKERRWPVTFSIGVVTFVEPPASLEAMLAEADAAMYWAKHRGKNRVAYRVVPQEAPAELRQALA